MKSGIVKFECSSIQIVIYISLENLKGGLHMKMYSAKEVLKQLWKVEFEPEVLFTLSLGPEMEFFVYDENALPVNLTRHLDFVSNMPNVWAAGTDLGLNQIEIAFDPQHSLGQYINSLYEVFTYLANGECSSNWRYLFAGTAKKTLGRVHTPKYDAKINALIIEDQEKGSKVVECMTKYSAFQVNMNVSSSQLRGVFSTEAKKLLFAFANWGPALCIYFEDLAGDIASKRLPNAYSFATDIRGFRYMDWEFCNNVEEELFNVPQLLQEQPGGVLEYCGKRPTTLSALHTGSIFWPARPQGIHDKTASRIEVRSLSSMTPLCSVRALRILNQLVTYTLATPVFKLPVLSKAEWDFIQKKVNIRKVRNYTYDFLNKLPVLL